VTPFFTPLLSHASQSEPIAECQFADDICHQLSRINVLNYSY